MGNCCGRGPVCSLLNKEGSSHLLVDIEKALLDYAWTNLADPTPMDKLLKDQRYDLEVNWAHLDIQHKITSFKLRSGDKKSASPKSKVKTRDLCLFSSVFRNDTAKEQTFTFKTERETKSTAMVSIQKGFQLGGHLDLSMSIPMPGQEVATTISKDIEAPCKVTGGLSGQLHVTKIKGETFEERLTWSVDTQVKVDAHKTCRAQLIVREKEMQADMTIISTIAARHKVIQVYVTHKQSRNLVVLEIPREQLSKILREDKNFTIPDKNIPHVVQCESKGIMHVIFGAEQEIIIDYDVESDYDLNPVLEEACTSLASTSVCASQMQGPLIQEVDQEDSENTQLLLASTNVS